MGQGQYIGDLSYCEGCSHIRSIRLPVILLLCPSDIIAFSFRRGRSEMDRITMNPNGTSHQTLICLEGPVSTRLESTLNLAILIAIDAIGDDHIFFIQARNLAGPRAIPEKMRGRPDMGR
jgi:hypothetical protein